MSDTGQPSPQIVTSEVVVEPQDKFSTYMKYAIFAGVILILTVLLYGLLAGVINRPAPRTAVEFALSRSERELKANPGSGRVWAESISTLMAAGSMDEAKAQLAKARKAVKDDSVVYINNIEVAILLSEEKYDEVLTKSKQYLIDDAKFRSKALLKYAQRGIRVPPETLAGQNAVTTDLAVYRARAAAAKKDWKTAFEAMDIALKASPQAADVQVLRGEMYLVKGDKKRAAADFQAALRFIPDYQAALDGLKKAGVKPASTPAQ